MDSRSQYYESWDARARSAVAVAETEDAKEKEAADAALALDRTPLSMAQKVDAEAHAALKEAKKKWTARDAQEQAEKYIATDSIDTDKQVIVIKSQSHRSQERNREDALSRLQTMVKAAGVLPKKRRPTKPTKGSKRRRLDSKNKRSQIKSSHKKVDLE